MGKFSHIEHVIIAQRKWRRSASYLHCADIPGHCEELEQEARDKSVFVFLFVLKGMIGS